jgi:hypothetical protein
MSRDQINQLVELIISWNKEDVANKLYESYQSPSEFFKNNQELFEEYQIEAVTDEDGLNLMMLLLTEALEYDNNLQICDLVDKSSYVLNNVNDLLYKYDLSIRADQKPKGDFSISEELLEKKSSNYLKPVELLSVLSPIVKKHGFTLMELGRELGYYELFLVTQSNTESLVQLISDLDLPIKEIK